MFAINNKMKENLKFHWETPLPLQKRPLLTRISISIDFKWLNYSYEVIEQNHFLRNKKIVGGSGLFFLPIYIIDPFQLNFYVASLLFLFCWTLTFLSLTQGRSTTELVTDFFFYFYSVTVRHIQKGLVQL